MTFQLHSNLAKKAHIVDLPLCQVLLEDENNYPWLILVPRRNGVSRIMDLAFEDQIQLLKELDAAQKILWDIFQPSQLNVAAIGNKTAQLHIHVIARKTSDPAWPGTVWDHPEKELYPSEYKQELIKLLVEKFSSKALL